MWEASQRECSVFLGGQKSLQTIKKIREHKKKKGSKVELPENALATGGVKKNLGLC